MTLSINDTQHYDIQHNDTQRKGTFVTLTINDTQHYDIQHNDTQHKLHSAYEHSVVMLRVAFYSLLRTYGKCRYVEWHYAGCYFAEYLGTVVGTLKHLRHKVVFRYYSLSLIRSIILNKY
jgi:hypothetical protein